MTPKWHFLTGIVAGLLSYFYFDVSVFYSVVLFLSCFLIDVDHYLFYAFYKKDFSFFSARRWCFYHMMKHKASTYGVRRKSRYPFFIFHGLEVIVPLYFISFIYPVLFFVFLGFFIHWVEDIIMDLIYPGGTNKFSIVLAIWDFIDKKGVEIGCFD